MFSCLSTEKNNIDENNDVIINSHYFLENPRIFNTNSFNLNFGDLLEVDLKNRKINSLVVDFVREDTNLIVGICLMNNDELFGRQIPDGLINTKCADMLDVVFIDKNSFKKFKVLKKVLLDTSKIQIGGQFPANDNTDIEMFYNLGIEKRKKEQTPCNKGIIDASSIRECYFALSKYRIEK